MVYMNPNIAKIPAQKAPQYKGRPNDLADLVRIIIQMIYFPPLLVNLYHVNGIHLDLRKGPLNFIICRGIEKG